MHKGAAYVFQFSQERGFGGVDPGKISQESTEKWCVVVANDKQYGYKFFPRFFFFFLGGGGGR